MIILYKANKHSLNGHVQAFFKPTSALYPYMVPDKANCFMLKNKHHPQTTVTHCQKYKNVEQFNK